MISWFRWWAYSDWDNGRSGYTEVTVGLTDTRVDGQPQADVRH